MVPRLSVMPGGMPDVVVGLDQHEQVRFENLVNAEKRGVEDVDGVAGADDFDVAAGVKDLNTLSLSLFTAVILISSRLLRDHHPSRDIIFLLSNTKTAVVDHGRHCHRALRPPPCTLPTTVSCSEPTFSNWSDGSLREIADLRYLVIANKYNPEKIPGRYR